MKARLFSSCILLALGTRLRAQESLSARSFPPEIQARMDSLRAVNYPPGTAEGLSETEMAEYIRLIDQHKTSSDEPFYVYAARMNAETQDRLRALFSRMSRRQQLAQRIVFVRPEPPHPHRPPAEADFAAFRDSTQYRVRIDYRPAGAEELARYRASDFWWHRIGSTQVRHAGSAYFTRDVDLQLRSTHEAAARRYAGQKDSYQMIMVNTRLVGRPVHRTAN